MGKARWKKKPKMRWCSKVMKYINRKSNLVFLCFIINLNSVGRILGTFRF